MLMGHVDTSSLVHVVINTCSPWSGSSSNAALPGLPPSTRVWFGGWHAIRHCARMLTVEPECAALVSSGRDRAAVLRLIRLAALPSAAALATVLALGWITVTASDPTVVVAEILRLLLALTVPHMVVVWWLDRATG